MNLVDLAEILKMAHKEIDAQWKALTPERRKRICDNIMKRAMARVEAKEKEAANANAKAK